MSFSEKLTNPPKNKPRHRNLIFHSEVFYGEFEALYWLNISNLLSVTCFRQRTVIIPNFVWNLTWFLWPSLFKNKKRKNRKVISPEFFQFCGSFAFFMALFIPGQGAPEAYGCKIWISFPPSFLRRNQWFWGWTEFWQPEQVELDVLCFNQKWVRSSFSHSPIHFPIIKF